MPQDPIDSILDKYEGDASSKPSGGRSSGSRPPSIPGTLPDVRGGDQTVEPFDPSGPGLDAILDKYDQPEYKANFGYGQQDYDAQGQSQNPPSIIKQPGQANGKPAKVVIDGKTQAPTFQTIGIPIEKSNAKGGDKTQHDKPRPKYGEPNLLGVLAPGVNKFLGEVEQSGGNPRKMLANREAVEEKRRANLRKEKEKLSNDINKAMMQGASKDSDFVKKGYKRLFDIDQALAGGSAPSIIKQGKAATQATTKAKVRIIDETGGKETPDMRRSRLTSEFNYIGGALNELGQDIGKAKIVLDSGTERLTRLKGLIEQGQTDLIPEYNEIVKRVQGIAASSQKKIDDYNALIQRAKPVGKAIDEYSAASRKKTQVTQQLNLAEKFVNSAAKLFGLPGFEEQVAPTGSLGGDIKSATKLAGRDLAQATGAVAGAPGEIIRGTSNAISQLAGLGPIDESIYKNDRAVQITQTLGEFAPYLLPGVGQFLMGTQGLMIGGAAIDDPSTTAKSVLDSINPLAEGLRPEERGVRALSMLMLAGAGKVKLSEALLKRNLMKSYGMTEVGANQILDWARQTVKQGAGGGVKGDVLYYLETLRGTKIGKVANQTAEYWHQQYQKFLAEGAQFAKDAKKAGATTTTGNEVVDATVLPPNVRPQTNAPELPGRSPVPTSATKAIDILGPKGEPSGWKLGATADRVQLINADGGTLDFPYTPGDNPSYQQALAQARAHAEGNAPATIQPEPTMPVQPKSEGIPWSNEITQAHTQSLLEKNPDQKLIFGGESFAGKPVTEVPLNYAKTLLEGWRQQYAETSNSELKAKLAHDITILEPYVAEQTALVEQAKAQTEAQAPKTNPITNEPVGGVKTAAAESAKVDPTGAWNNVQKYDLAKAKEGDLTGKGGYKEVGNSGWFVGDASGGVGMFRPGEGKSYFFPFNDDEDGARKAATDWASNNQVKQTLKIGDTFRHYNGGGDFHDLEITKITKGRITFRHAGSDSDETQSFPRDYMESKGYTFDENSTEDTSKDQSTATSDSKPGRQPAPADVVKKVIDTQWPVYAKIYDNDIKKGKEQGKTDEEIQAALDRERARYTKRMEDAANPSVDIALRLLSHLDSKNARTIFEKVHGVKLPKTAKETEKFFREQWFTPDEIKSYEDKLASDKAEKDKAESDKKKADHQKAVDSEGDTRYGWYTEGGGKQKTGPLSELLEYQFGQGYQPTIKKNGNFVNVGLASADGRSTMKLGNTKLLQEYVEQQYEKFKALGKPTEKQPEAKPDVKTEPKKHGLGQVLEYDGRTYRVDEIDGDRAVLRDLGMRPPIGRVVDQGKGGIADLVDWSDQSNKTKPETKPTQVKDEQTNKGPSLRLVPPGDEPKIGDKVTERALRRFAKNWRPVEDSESALTDSAFDYEGTAIKIASAKIPGIYDDYAYALAFPDLSYIYLGKAQGKIDVENPSDDHIAILERAKEEAYSKITKQIDNHDWTKQINPGNQSPSEWVAEIAKKKNFGANRTWLAKDAAEWLMEHTAEYLVVPSKIDGDFKITYDKQAGKAYAYSSGGDISYLASIPYTGSYEETKLIENSFERFLRGKTTSDFQQAKEIEAESISEPETKSTQVKDEPKTEAPSNDRQVKTGDTLFDTLREYDNKATDDELKELADDVKRVAEKTIKLWDPGWEEKENYRSSLINKINDVIYNNAPMESTLFERSSEVAQKIAETYIQPGIQFSRSDVQDEITKALYEMDVLRNAWASGDKPNFELELTKQYDRFVGRRLGELAQARNVRGAQLYNEQGPSGGDDYNAIRQEVIRLLGRLLGALPSNQSQTPPVRTSLTDGFDIRGNRRAVDSILAFPQMDPNTPVLNGKNWKEHTEKFEALVEQEVLQGKVVVVNMAPFKKYLGLTEEQEEELNPFSVPEIEAKTAGVIPLRWGAPRVLLVTPEQAKILDGGDEPLRVWRLWRYKFDPKTDAYIVGDPNAIWNELMRRSGVEPKTELKNEVKEALDEVVKSGTEAINNLTDEEIADAELRAELEAMFDEALAEKTQASIKEAETRATQPKEPKSPRTNAPQPREPKQAPTKKDKAAEIASAFGEGVDANAVANILDILGNDGIVREDTPGYAHKSGPIRAVGTNDANPQRIKLAGQRFSWMVDREGSVLASAIASEWVRGNGSDLVGKVVTSFQDLAVAAQILRNPGYETFRWFAVKNGIVVAESAYSSRLPTSTVTFSQWIDSQGTNVQEWLKSFLDENDADGFYLLHNHPSGNPEPSLADVLLTRQIATWDRRFKGHVVINSTTYAKIDTKGEPQYFKLAKNDQKQVLALKAGPVVGRPVNGMATIAQIGVDLKAPKGYVTMVAVDSKSKIRAVFEVSTNQFFGKEKHSAKWAAAYISKLRRDSGAAFMYAVIDRSDANGNIPRIKQAITTGFLDDVIILKSVEGTAKSNAESVRTSLPSVDENLSTRLGRPAIKGRVAREAGFSDQVYSQLKPELQKIWNAASSQGMDIKQFFAKLLEQFPATIRPYAIQFATEIRKGVTNANDQRERDQLDGDTETPEGTTGSTKQPGVRGGRGGGKTVSGDGVDDVPPVGEDVGGGTSPVDSNGETRPGNSRGSGKNRRVKDEDKIGETTESQKKKDLIAALEVIRKLDKSKKAPTKADQDIVARFPGWGWTGNMLNFGVDAKGKTRSSDPEFRDQVAELLTKEEMEAAQGATLNSHYTAIPIVDAHWDVAKRLGFKTGNALEPSAGIGYFLGRAPNGVKWTAVELDSLSARILEILYPEERVIHAPFEDIKGKGDKDLMISNVPFGRYAIADYDFEKQITKEYSREIAMSIHGSIHNYFMAKGLEHLKEEGLMIVTTSAFSMNGHGKDANNFRAYMEQKAHFVGAIRLPETAFRGNAGADVTTDILIFKKRKDGKVSTGAKPWMQSNETILPTGESAFINQYFLDNPEMVLGTHSMRGKMGPSGDPSYTVKADTSTPLEEQIKKVIAKLPKDIFNNQIKEPEIDRSGPKPPSEVRPFGIFESDGKMYVKTSQYESTEVVYLNRSLNSEHIEQLRKYIKIRSAVSKLVDVNRTTTDDNDLVPYQKALVDAYNDYFKKYGRIQESKNSKLLKSDAEWALVYALEEYSRFVKGYNKNDKPMFGQNFEQLAPIFTKRVASFNGAIEKAADPESALIASLSNLGQVSLKEMTRVSGISESDLLSGLKGQIFFDPTTDKYVMRDEYGSGNVVKKLKDAEQAAEALPEKYAENVKFLKSVQPEPMPTEQIKVPLGTTWIPPQHISDFLSDLAGTKVNVKFNPVLREWVFPEGFAFPTVLDVVWKEPNESPVEGAPTNDQADNQRTGRMPYKEVVKAALENSLPEAKIFAGYDENRRPVYQTSKVGTNAAISAVDRLRKQWASYWKTDETLAPELTKLYNEIVNVMQRRVYDGSFLSLPGLSPTTANGDPLKLRPHQMNAIWRNIAQDFSLDAHGVGAGKTWVMIGLANELKRMGKRQKPLIVAKNETEVQVVQAINMMYPGSRVLFVEPGDMDKQNRKYMMGRIAAGDYDFIIMRHSDFKLLPVSNETYELELRAMMEEIYTKALGLDFDLRVFDPYSDDGRDGPSRFDLMRLDDDEEGGVPKKQTVKKLWQQLKNLAGKHKRRMQKQLANQDIGLYFEQLGIDHIILDESHYHKDVGYVSKKKGMGSAGSEIGNDLLMKVNYLRRVGGGATLLTGTPIVNTVSELYTQFLLLAPELLKEQGSLSFDEWAQMFAEYSTTIEQDVSGRFKPVTRISKYINQAQLVDNFWHIADVQLTENLPGVKRPNAVDEQGNATFDDKGKPVIQPIVIESQPSIYNKSHSLSLVKRAEEIEARRSPPERGDDIMLSLANDARLDATDIRLVDPSMPDLPDSKINIAVRKILEIYHDPEVSKRKGTQLVFLERGVPKKTSPPPENLYFTNISFALLNEARAKIEQAGYQAAEPEENEDGSWNLEPDLTPEFNLYEDIRQKLVAGGIPKEEVEFMQTVNTQAEKKDFFDKMNSGRLRVAITSTAKGGVGVNVQERLFALHNLDCPWTPADYEQRLGRIVRQGNSWIDKGVRVYNHITVGSFDAFMWNVLARKIVPITQMMKGDVTKSEIEVESMSEVTFYEEQAARAAGRTDILDWVRIKREKEAIDIEKSSFDMQVTRKRNRLREANSRLPGAESELKKAKADRDLVQGARSEQFKYASHDGFQFEKPKEAGEYILKRVLSRIPQMYRGSRERINAGKLSEFTVVANVEMHESLYSIEISLTTPGYPSATVYVPLGKRIGRDELEDEKELSKNAIYLMSSITRALNTFNEKLIAELEGETDYLQRQKISIEKSINDPWDQLEEFEDISRRYDALYESVGKSLEGEGAVGEGWGGGLEIEDDPLGVKYWLDLRDRKVKARLAEYEKKQKAKQEKERQKKLAEKATGDESAVNFAFTPGGKGAPKTPPSSTPSSVAPLSDKIENRWNWYDNILRFMAPGSRDGGARRAEIWLRSLHGDRARVEAVIGHVLSDLQRHLDRVPKEVAYEFIDAIENGLPVPGGTEKITKVFTKKSVDALKGLFGKDADTMTFQDAADFIRTTLDALREEINQMDPSKLQEFYENYFPHLWVIDESQLTVVQGKLKEWFDIQSRKPGAGKRPIEGSKSAFKKRSIPTIKEGMEDFGLKPVSDNPVDLLLLHIRDMNKFIIATQFKEQLKANGMLVFVPFGQRAGQGFEKINSTFFDVYSPGEINVKFSFDQRMMNSLMEVAKAIGVNVEYDVSAGRAKKGGTVWGNQSGDNIKMRYGSTLEALTHEIGHALDDKFKITEMFQAGDKGKRGAEKTQRDIIEMQLRSLAELRYESVDDPGESYRSYTNKPAELTANFVHLYVHAKGLVKQFAPDALKAFTDFKKGNKTLAMLDKIEGGAEIGEMEATYKVFGRTYTGSYYAPSGAAQVINNYLSPGISGADVALARDAYNFFRVMNNSLNSIQLGFDGFHGLVTMLNATMTEVDVAVGYMEAGDFPKALKAGLTGLSLIGPMAGGWKRGAKIREAYLSATISDPQMKELVEWITLAGGRATPDPVYVNDMRRKLRIAWRDKKNFDDWKSAIPGVPAKVAQLAWFGLHAFNESTSHWLMESLVPSLKLYAFEQLASVEMAKLAKQKPSYSFEDKQATLQRAWDSIDNRFGQMVYDNVFFNKIVKDTATITFRAFGWNYGTIREVGGSVVDAGRQIKGLAGGMGGGGSKPPTGGGAIVPGDPDEPPFVPDGLTPRQRYSWIAMTGITALVGAILTKLMSGENPRELRDYMFPRTGQKNPDGTPERTALPTYTKDVENYVFRPVQTLKGKLSPGIGVITDIWRNADFYGVTIRNDRDGFMAQGAQLFGWYVMQYQPVAFRKKNEFDDAGVALGPLSLTWQRWFGLMPAPMWTTRSAAIQKAYELRGKRVAGVEKTRVEQQSRDARMQFQSMFYQKAEAVQKGKTKEAESIEKKQLEMIKKYPNEFKRALKNVIHEETGEFIPPLVQAINNLGLDEILEVRKVATKAEIPFIDKAIMDLGSKLKEKADKQREKGEAVTVDLELLMKAAKIIGTQP